MLADKLALLFHSLGHLIVSAIRAAIRVTGKGSAIRTLARLTLHALAENRMQATPCHDFGSASQDSGGGRFYIHQFEETKRRQRMIEEQVDIGILESYAKENAPVPGFLGTGAAFVRSN